MDFSSIQSSIYALWKFSWPPLLFLVTAGFALRRWFPTHLESLASISDNHFGDDHKSNRLRSFLHSIGASKLYPASLAVLLILSFHLINEFISFCQWFPPSHFYRSDVIAASLLRDGDRYLLSQLYPEASGFGDAFYRAYSEVDTSRSISERFDFYFKLQMTAKAIAVLMCALALHTLFRRPNKLRGIRGAAITAVLCLLIWFVCLIPILRETEIEVQRNTTKIFTSLRERAVKASIVVPKNPGASLPEGFWHDSRRGERWWGLTLTPTDSVAWFCKTFFPSAPSDGP